MGKQVNRTASDLRISASGFHLWLKQDHIDCGELASTRTAEWAEGCRTSEQVEASIVELRTRERRGRDLISAELNVPAHTVSSVLARHGIPHLNELDSITGALLRALQEDDPALRTRPSRRTGPYGRQEARPDS